MGISACLVIARCYGLNKFKYSAQYVDFGRLVFMYWTGRVSRSDREKSNLNAETDFCPGEFVS
jgi:hypothetical protein